ncbi:MarR family winged helix-turn-helix transcriptional regulator [Salininema proteolyticum]|uniref:MarR family winged helix-turn-helix transcriptional regulator n=1 Tax=Salininema proteolyticum TaxID=1607685 RepID=A0ABV8TZC3_9ACTN
MDDSREPELLFQLGMAFQMLLTEFTARMSEAGYDDLRPVHGYAFQALKEGGATSTELSQHLGVTKQAAGQIVDHLTGRGYVERLPHPDGGRRKLVVLTDKGWRHMADAGRILRSLEAEVASGYGDLSGLKSNLSSLLGALGDGELPPFRPVW